MRLRPKTVRRLALVAGVMLLAGGAAGGIVLAGRVQRARLLEEHREAGLAAASRGDLLDAVNNLGWYLKRRPQEGEILLAYARARASLEEPGGAHLGSARVAYERYLSLSPEDAESRRALLEVYLRSGYFREARDLAQRMRPKDLGLARDREVLLGEARALVASNDAARAVPVAQRLVELDGEDLDARLLLLDAMSRSGQAEGVREHVRAYVGAAPEEPRRRLVEAMTALAQGTPGEFAGARAALLALARLDEGERGSPGQGGALDAAAARHLAGTLDRLGEHEEALAVLVRAPGGTAEEERLIVRRLWQAGRGEEVLARAQGLAADAHADLVAFRALALTARGASGEAEDAARALGERRGDYRASAWSAALGALQQAEGRARIEALELAAARNPGEPVIRVMLGEALARAGRTDAAVRSWAQAEQSPLATGWAAPALRCAEALLRDGRVLDAADAAARALRIAPRDVQANLVWLEAQAARAAAGHAGGPRPGELLRMVESRMRDLEEMGLIEARDALVPLLASLTVQVVGADAGREVIAGALAAPGALTRQALYRLADVSRSAGLGLEEALLTRAESLHGTSLGSAWARAVSLADAGDPGKGAAALRAGRERAGAGAEREWDLALARFADGYLPGEALAALGEVQARYGEDAAAQRLVLESRHGARDPELVGRAIERFKALSGARGADEPATVRLARARVLLAHEPGARERDRAIALLGSVLADRPRDVQARVLLAEAHSLSDESRGLSPDLSAASRHLAAAAEGAPRRGDIALRLGEVLQAQRDYARARGVLARLAGDAGAAPAERLRAGEMLLAQGDAREAHQAAERLLADAARPAGEGALHLKAAAAERLRDEQGARDAYRRLEAAGIRSGGALVDAAAYFERTGDVERARRLDERIDEMERGETSRRMMRAAIARRAGRNGDAARLLDECVRDDPSALEAWRALVDLRLEAGEHELAARAAEEALRLNPGEPAAQVLAARSRLARGADDALDALIDALGADPATAPNAAALAEIRRAHAAGELDDARGLMALAERLGGDLGARVIAAQRLATLDPPRLREATEVAVRAMRDFPASPEPARLATELFLAMGRYAEMLDAARAWRDRDVARGREPDLALAEALLRTGRGADAVDLLRPLLPAAAARLGDQVDLGIVNIAARALVASGREPEARSLLEPLLPGSAAIRVRVWLGIAAGDLRDPGSVRDWLGLASVAIAPSDTEGRVALAAAYSSAARRLGTDGAGLLDEGVRVLEELAAEPAPGALVLESLAVLLHAAGRIDEAAGRYAEAVALDGSRAISLNNLANIELERGRLAEAAELARRAVEATRGRDADAADTLATVLGARARAERSTASYAAAMDAYTRLAEILPGSPAPLGALAALAEDFGDAATAIRAYEALVGVPGLRPLPLAAAKNNLACALLDGARGAGDASRALALARDAVGTAPEPAFLDTLGRAQMATGDRAGAVESFRRARALSPGNPVIALGLAWSLCAGGEAEREEALRLVEEVEGMLPANEAQAAAVSEALERVRRALPTR